MLTLLDHSRYAFFRNRSLHFMRPGNPNASPNFWRWFQITFIPMVRHMHADMPRHAKCFEYRHKEWRKSKAERKPVRAKWKCVRGQRIRGHFDVLLPRGSYAS